MAASSTSVSSSLPPLIAGGGGGSVQGAPINVYDYQLRTANKLSRVTYDFYASGSNDMITLQANERAYNMLRIRPRVLVDVKTISTSITLPLCGSSVSSSVSQSSSPGSLVLPSPILVAPCSLQKLAHDDGEIAMATAASKVNTVFGLSSTSTTSIEEVAKAVPNVIRWFQVYVLADRSDYTHLAVCMINIPKLSYIYA
jgi:isopentenyl diphosphate isomerase/L-lactate dehydrogenase-like FMN-dependent dehydrogenase